MKSQFKNVSRLLKDYRKKKGLSQGKAGKLTGTHVQLISNIERGLCSIPMGSIPKFCEALSIPREAIHMAVIDDYSSRLDASFKQYWTDKSLANEQVTE